MNFHFSHISKKKKMKISSCQSSIDTLLSNYSPKIWGTNQKLVMSRSRIQPNEIEVVLRESMQSYWQGRSVCQTKLEAWPLYQEERHCHKKFRLQTENITCYTCGKRFQNWKEHEAKHHCNVEGEILSGIICVASSSWTDACFLMKVEDEGSFGKDKVEPKELKVEKGGEKGKMEGGEQKLEKEEGEGGVNVDELPPMKVDELSLLKVEGRKRNAAPGEN